MKTSVSSAVLALVLFGSNVLGAVPPDGAKLLSRLPLAFEENRGQTWDGVRFLARGPGYTAWVLPDRVVVRRIASCAQIDGDARGPRVPTSSSLVTLRFLGADPNAETTGTGIQPGALRSYRGPESVTTQGYTRVAVEEPWPGIDLVHYGAGSALEHDFLVAPGADPSRIRLSLESSDGGRPELQTDGSLGLRTGSGLFRLERPVAYQDEPAGRRPVAATYRLSASGVVTIATAGHDPRYPLVVDPILRFSGFVGGNSSDEVEAVAVDHEGSIILTGSTISSDFPLAPGGGPSSDAFITKVRADGSALVYSTVFGGFGTDIGRSVATDPWGNATFVGYTTSGNLPVAGGPLEGGTYAGGGDGFVARVAPGGDLLYSAYIGGASGDDASGVAVDVVGDAYVVGYTSSPDFVTVPGSHDLTLGGTEDAFLTKVRMVPGQGYVYSTYLGGTGSDSALAVALAPGGRAPFVTGSTTGSFPVTTGQTPYGGGLGDAFIASFGPAGNLLGATYYGGNGIEAGTAIAVDRFGDPAIVGYTTSTDLPLASSVQGSLGGSQDAFVLLLPKSLAGRFIATYFGGSGSDDAEAVAIDTANNIVFVGSTAGIPTTADAIQPAFGGGASDAFVAAIGYTAGGGVERPGGVAPVILHATYVGGAANDHGSSLALDGQRHMIVGGRTGSPGFPATPGVFDSTCGSDGTCNGGSFDGFVAKIGASRPCPNTSFTGPDAVGISHPPLSAIAAGDLGTPDGFDDLVVTTQQSGSPGVIVLENSTVATFSGLFASVPGGASSVALGDLNGDGQLEIVVGRDGSGQYRTYSYASGGPFTQLSEGPLRAGVSTLALGDVNGDGVLDLVYGHATGYTVALGDGTGGFSGAPFDRTTAAPPGKVGFLDANQDGRLDIVAVLPGLDLIEVALGLGSGLFSAPTAIAATAGDLPRTFATGDMDRDGWTDLVVGNLGAAAQVTVYLNDQTGGFVEGTHVTGQPEGVTGLVVTDFHRDDLLDFNAVSSSTDRVWGCRGDGTGTFPGCGFKVQSYGTPAGIAAGDFNGDGKIEFAIASVDGDVRTEKNACASIVFTPSTFSVGLGMASGAATLEMDPAPLAPVTFNLHYPPAAMGQSQFSGPGQVTIAKDQTSVTFSLNGDVAGAASLLVAEAPASPFLSIVAGANVTVGTPASANLGITLTDSPDPVLIGGNITYTATVTNAGPDTATGVVVTHVYPSGLVLLSAIPSQGTCTTASLDVSCALGSIANAGTATVTLVYTVGGSPRVVTSTFGVTSAVTDPVPGNDSATTTTTVGAPPSANLGVTLTDSPDPVLVGGSITYTATITNAGPDTATGVTLTQLKPTGATLVSAVPSQGACTPVPASVTCALGSLANAASATVTMIYTADGPAGSVVATSTVASGIADPVNGNNSATATTTVGAPAAPIYTNGELVVGEGNGLWKRYDRSGTFLGNLDSGVPSALTGSIAWDATGHAYGPLTFGNAIAKLNPQGGLITNSFGGTQNATPEKAVVAADGNIFVGLADGARTIQKFSPSGVLLASYAVATGPRGPAFIAQAPGDSCTVYYATDSTSIRRYDTCTQTQLPDFATGLAGPVCYDLQSRPNGEWLVACSDRVHRLSAAGAVLQTYTGFSPAPVRAFALGLDIDGTSFWVADNQPSGRIWRFDIASGSQLFTFTTPGSPFVSGFAIYGTPAPAPPVSGAFRVIAGNPLTINVGADAAFQVFNATVPGQGQIYPSGTSTLADMGVFVRRSGTLFAPDFSLHSDGTATSSIGAYTAWVPVSISNVTGAGTAVSPYQVVVVCDAGATGLRLTMTVNYVNGDSYFTKTMSWSSASTTVFDAFLGSDFYLANDDDGVPFVEPTSTSPGGQDCGSTPTYTILHIPLTPAQKYSARGYSAVWSEIGAGTLSNLKDSGCLDNGAALQWQSLTAGPSGPAIVDAATSFGAIPSIARFRVDAVTPAQGAPGQNLTVSVTGIGFQAATQFAFGADITAQSPTILSPTSATVAISIAPGAALGFRDVLGTQSPGGLTSTLTNGFEVSGGGAVAPDLALSKSHGGNFSPGLTGSFTLTATNLGNGPTTGPVTIVDTLPAGLTFVSAAGPGWSCSAAGQTVTCVNTAPIPAGGASGFSLRTLVSQSAPSSVVNTATVSTAGDTNAANNSATDRANVSRQDFRIVVTPTSLTLAPGATGSVVVSATRQDNFSLPIAVTFAQTPGLTFSPQSFSLTTGATQTVQVTVAADAVASTLDVTISGTSNLSGAVATRTAQLRVTIQVQADFELVLSPTSLRLVTGGPALPVQVSVLGRNGLNGTVNVTAPSLSGVTFTPSTFTLGAGGTQTVNVAALASTGTGMTAAVFSGTATGITGPRTASLALTIVSAGDFTIDLSPSGISAGQGSSVNVNVAITPQNGFTGAVALVVSPSEGVTVTPSSFALDAGTSRNITLSISPTAAPGQRVLTFTGTASGVDGPRQAELRLTINPPPPQIVFFRASPASITAGQDTELSWDTVNATSVSLSPGGSVALTGTTRVSPAQTTVYTLTARGSGGSATAQVTVEVCTVPAAPTNLRILPFGRQDAPVSATDYLILSWDLPVEGSLPTRYEYRINGDAWVSTTERLVVVPPRGNTQNIQLFVRAYACTPELGFGPEGQSAVVSLGAPIADFTMPPTAVVGAPVTITDLSLPPATSWLWLYDDGSPASTTQSQVHTFPRTGTFSVTLIAINGSGASTKTRTIVINAAAPSPAELRASSSTPLVEGAQGRLGSAAVRGELVVTSRSSREEIAYLRFLDARGTLLYERRLVLAPCPVALGVPPCAPGEQPARYDLSAFGVEGASSIELVSGARLSGSVEEPR